MIHSDRPLSRPATRRVGELCLAMGLVLALVAAPLAAQQAPNPSPGGTRTLEIVGGNQLTQETVDGQAVQRLRGNARLRMEETLMRAVLAVKYPNRAILERNVVIIDEGDTLWADRVVFRTRTKIGEATGAVRLSDGGAMLYAPSGTYNVDAKLATFEAGVRLVDTTSVLTSRRGTYGTETKVAVFVDDVRLRQEDLWLEADSLTHDREAGTSRARGRVFVEQIGGGAAESRIDTTTRTFLFGEDVVHSNPDRTSRVEGRPLLVQFQVDSAATDTLLISARVLDAVRTDTLERLVATDSVRIWQTDLTALADSAVYLKRRIPRAPTDTTGSFAATDVDTTLASGVPVDAALTPADTVTFGPVAGDSTAVAPAPADTARTQLLETLWLFGEPIIWVGRAQVTGDTVRVTLRDGAVDSLFVDGNAFVAQEDSLIARIQQMRGRTLRGRFEADSLRALRIGPNAEALYFRVNEEERALEQAIQVSSDALVFTLYRDEIRQVRAYSGKPQGIQASVYEPDAVPEAFALRGFTWMPERRPRRDQFFRDPARTERLIARLTRTEPSPPEPDTPPTDVR